MDQVWVKKGLQHTGDPKPTKVLGMKVLIQQIILETPNC